MRQLVISFLGRPAGYVPCDDNYTASPAESRAAVAFAITERPPARSPNATGRSLASQETVQSASRTP